MSRFGRWLWGRIWARWMRGGPPPLEDGHWDNQG